MNSLKLIDKLIMEHKINIDIHKGILLIDDSRKFFHNKVIKESEESINVLRQIKAELEAWYVLKPDLEHTENDLGEHEIELRKFYTDADVELHDTKEKYYKLKKALEVKNE